MKFELQKWHKKAVYFILVAVVIFSSWSLFTSKPNTDEMLMMSLETKKAIRLDQAEMKAIGRLTNQETTTSKIPSRFTGNPAFKVISYFQSQFQETQNENRQPASVGEGK